MLVIMPIRTQTAEDTMSTKTIIAAAVVAVFIAPAPASAKALTGRLQATSGAFAAATKPSRTVRSTLRNGVAQTSIQRMSGSDGRVVLGSDGRVVGADPDAGIRFQLRRDGGMERGSGGGSGGGGGSGM
jgi:hypothetical protein